MSLATVLSAFQSSSKPRPAGHQTNKQTNKQKTPPCCALYESLTHTICEDYMWLFYATKLWDNL